MGCPKIRTLTPRVALRFNPVNAEKLVHSAAKLGRNADELVQEVLARYLADEATESSTFPLRSNLGNFMF
jgi:hypothetical protein